MDLEQNRILDFKDQIKKLELELRNKNELIQNYESTRTAADGLKLFKLE